MTYEVLILAAGEASRFGAPKQLAIYRGMTLLERVIKLAHSLGKKPFVTLGAHSEQILSHPSLNTLLETDANVIQMNEWQEGMSRSLVEGVKEIASRQADGVLILLADQPLITRNDLIRLMNSVTLLGRQIIASSYEKAVGVPAYFSHHFFQDLMTLEGDKGARRLIVANKHKLVDMNHRLVDIDTPEQLKALCSEPS